MSKGTLLTIGAGPGMSLATAERFGREGWQVILTSRKRENAEKHARTLQEHGIEAQGYSVDADSAKQVAELIERLAEAHGPIDVLHYNAASMRQASLFDQPRETFVYDLNVNIGGAMVAMQAMAPYMFEQGRGTILLTGGGFGVNPAPQYLSLSIGKAGIRALAKGTFDDFAEWGVHVATVTVNGFVDPGSELARDVAEGFWTLHSQSRDDWTWELNVPEV